jgi:hypothetical protein
MSAHKSIQAQPYPLKIRLRLLDTPELLPHENAEEFVELFNSLEDYGKPQNTRDYLAVHQATVLTWDILRYQTMKIGVLRSHHRPALESLVLKTQVTRPIVNALSESAAKMEVQRLVAPWFNDPACRPNMTQTIENAGYPPDALEVEAFTLALPALATIERLIASAQKRLNVFLDDLERSSKANARVLRLATETAVTAKTASPSQAKTADSSQASMK